MVKASCANIVIIRKIAKIGKLVFENSCVVVEGSNISRRSGALCRIDSS